MATELLQATEVVLGLLRANGRLLLLLFLELRDGALKPLGGVRVGWRVLPKHIRVATKAAPAGDDVIWRERRPGQLLQLGRKRLEAGRGGCRQKPTPLAIFEGAARVLKSARERGRVFRGHGGQAVPPYFQLGDVIRTTFA